MALRWHRLYGACHVPGTEMSVRGATANNGAAAALVAALAAAGVVAGCSSRGADKAGGSSTPTVLRLASYVRSMDSPAHADLDFFTREVDKLSGGGLRISVTFMPEGSDPSDAAFEARIVRSVR